MRATSAINPVSYAVGKAAALGLLFSVTLPLAGAAADTLPPADTTADGEVASRVADLTPRLETVIAEGMKAFDNPGLAIGIEGGEPVDTRTVFQIGSATKGFLATTMAIAVDRGRFSWDDRIVDLDPEFQLKDPWVTQEFRVFDIIAQRSGLPPYANDMLSMFDPDEAALIRSLRFVDPVSSFRSTFAYTNITHLVAGRIVARAEEAADWEAVVRMDIIDPLGMATSSMTAEAIEAETNHASGHAWSPPGTVEVPFTPLYPYLFAGAGAMNSNIDDMTRWIRLQLGNGTFEGKAIVSPENLKVTRMARVALSDKAAYAMGWVIQSTTNGEVVWHNGGTPSFGAYVGFSPDKGFGVVVLTNESNAGFPDAIGAFVLDRLLGNPEVDHVAAALARATATARSDDALWARPEAPRPSPPLAGLAGGFAHPAFGKATVSEDGDTLAMTFDGGAVLKLSPWDGSVFTVSLVPEGRFAAMAANQGPAPVAFAQFQMDASGKLDVLRLTAPDGQSYPFDRE